MIKEDWERMYQLDQMYLDDKQVQIEEEWKQYEEEQEKLPARITVEFKTKNLINEKVRRNY